MFRGRKKHWLGLDINQELISLVELISTDDGWLLHGAKCATMPANCFVAGKIVKLEEVVLVINSLLIAIKAQTKNTVMAVAEENIFTRIDKQPKNLFEDEILANIRAEAASYIPLSLAEVSLDFYVLDSAPDATSLEVVTVAVKNEFIDNKLDLAKALKLRLRVVDVDRYAVWRAVRYFLVQQGQYKPTDCYFLVNIKFSRTTVKIYRADQEIFTTDIVIGTGHIASFTAKTQLSLGELGGQSSHQRDTRVNLTSSTPSIEELANEIFNLLLVATNTHGPLPISFGLLVCSASVSDLAQSLTISCGFKFLTVNPFVGMPNALNIDAVKTNFVCAVGLAMRGGEQ